MVAYFDPIDFNYQSYTWKYGKPITINTCLKIAFSPDGKFLVSSDSKGCGKLWNEATSEEVCTLSDENAITFGYFFAFSRDGKVLAGTNYFWNVETCKPISQIEENFSDGNSLGQVVAFSADLQIVASARQAIYSMPPDWVSPQVRAKNSTYVTAIEVATGEELCCVDLPRPFTETFNVNHYYRQTKFSPDGRFLTAIIELGKKKLFNELFGGGLIYFGNDALELHEIATEKRIWMIKNERQDSSCNEVMFSPNGKVLASSWAHIGNKRHTILLSDVATGKKLCHIAIDNFSEDFPDFSPFPCLAFSSDSQILAIGLGQGQIGLWHLTSGRSSSFKAQKIQTLSGNASKVVSLAFSPNGRTLAQAGSDAIEFWHLT
jgi:WD40 repeat protein